MTLISLLSEGMNGTLSAIERWRRFGGMPHINFKDPKQVDALQPFIDKRVRTHCPWKHEMYKNICRIHGECHGCNKTIGRDTEVMHCTVCKPFFFCCVQCSTKVWDHRKISGGNSSPHKKKQEWQRSHHHQGIWIKDAAGKWKKGR